MTRFAAIESDESGPARQQVAVFQLQHLILEQSRIRDRKIFALMCAAALLVRARRNGRPLPPSSASRVIRTNLADRD